MNNCFALCPIIFAFAAAHADVAYVRPFESGAPFQPVNALDHALLAGLTENGCSPAHQCSDEIFVRRVFLDVIGTLPTPQESRAFLQDTRPVKRAELIESLLMRPEFTEFWALKWGDLLRIKAEFPINLWPNAVQAYHRWVWESIRDNRPYDQFVRSLLTASGSNFRVPPVNFFRAVQGRAPADLAAAAALTFMGQRFDAWPEEKRAGMAAFFSRLAYKKTGEWKEEIIGLDPAPAAPLDAVFPDGRTVSVPAGTDPRQVFADWLVTPENPWFTRNIANRVWAWLMGRGIIHEPDDIRPDNPPSNPALLECLEKELIAARYDIRQLLRLILNSSAYQQSPIPQCAGPQADALFAAYPLRRLDAEVLIDALNRIGGAGEEYSSPIPEPFTFIPATQRSIALADGSITSAFLEMFGRPARDTGLESERNNQPNDAQRLFLLNSTNVQRKIQQSGALRLLAKNAKGNKKQIIRGIYIALLARYPEPAELSAALAYVDDPARTPKQSVEDLTWALLNTKEFLYRH